MKESRLCHVTAVTTAALTLVLSATADVIYDNGPIITRTGVGAFGADVSELQTRLDMNYYGFGCQRHEGNRLADDFTATGGVWTVTGFVFWAYQTNSSTNSTIIEVNVRLWDGRPGDTGSFVVAGDSDTNVITGSVFSRVYRLKDIDNYTTTVNRPIMRITATLETPVVLEENRVYWVDWQLEGTLASGPWVPPVTILGRTQKPDANGRQYLAGVTNAWTDAIDTGISGNLNKQQDVPFQVLGTIAGPVGIPPLEYTFFRGIEESGDLASLALSDDNALVAKNGVTALPTEAPITLRVSATSPVQNPRRLRFRVENKVSINGLNQYIDLFDYLAGQYENVDTRAASTSDFVVIAEATNPPRFVELTTMNINSQIRIKPTGPVFTNTWRSFFDQTIWMVN